eukprot:676802-Amphidinium_carterae.1
MEKTTIIAKAGMLPSTSGYFSMSEILRLAKMRVVGCDTRGQELAWTCVALKFHNMTIMSVQLQHMANKCSAND